LGQAGWDQLHAHPTKAEVLPDMQSNFTQGGVNKFEEEGGAGRDGYFGWFGYGGSVFQWNPELQIGFAYTPTMMEWYDISNNKGRLLQAEVAKCAKKLQAK